MANQAEKKSIQVKKDKGTYWGRIEVAKEERYKKMREDDKQVVASEEK